MDRKTTGEDEPAVSFHMQRDSIDFISDSNTNDWDAGDQFLKINKQVLSEKTFVHPSIPIPRRLLAVLLIILILIVAFIAAVLYQKSNSLKMAELENQIELLMVKSKEMEYTFGGMNTVLINNTNAVEDHEISLETLRDDANNTAQALENEIESLQRKGDEFNERLNDSLHRIQSNQENISAINTQLNIIMPSVKEIKNDLRTLSNDTKNTAYILEHGFRTLKVEPNILKQELNGLIEVECGGIVSLPAADTSFLLAYKRNQEYENLENCLWLFEKAKNANRSKVSVKIKLISHGFADANDGLSAFEFNRGPDLTSRRIEPNTEYTSTSDEFYLSFTSNSYSVGTGFYLRMSISETTGTIFVTHEYNSNSTGNYTASSYLAHELRSIVIKPPSGINFNLTKVHTRSGYDFLVINEIHELGRFTKKMSYTGNLTNPLRFQTSGPILAVLTTVTDGGSDFDGFDLNWI